MAILSLFNLRKNIVENPSKDILYCPVTGKLIKLEDVNDEFFSKKMMGEGVAVYPKDSIIGSPVNGIITSVFPTKHAITIKGEKGCDLLIHIGIDTVDLKGKYFSCKVKEGDYVKAGQSLLNVDFRHISKLGYDITTMLIICNSKEYEIHPIHQKCDVLKNDSIIKVKSKECYDAY